MPDPDAAPAKLTPRNQNLPTFSLTNFTKPELSVMPKLKIPEYHPSGFTTVRFGGMMAGMQRPLIEPSFANVGDCRPGNAYDKGAKHPLKP